MGSPAKETLAIILAGGRGTRLGALTEREAKPALPFGGHCRTIDFTLSNCVNSGIGEIGVATQYRPQTLEDHTDTVWRPIAGRRGVIVRNWPASNALNKCYTGTADAVYKNWPRIERSGARFVLVLAGDHVYKMDYTALIEQHIARGADATVGCVEAGLSEARQFGIMAVDETGRILRFDEKPADPEPMPGRPDRALASMGIYVFDTDFLKRVLEADAASVQSSHDFGHDIITKLIGEARLFGYRFGSDARVGAGYWRDIGTLAAYWRAHMELLAPDSVLMRTQLAWPILTAPPRRPGARENGAGEAWQRRAISACSASLAGALVTRSVLCEGVRVGAHSCIRNSVVLPGASIGRNCYLDKTIVTAGCHVPDNTVIGQPQVLRETQSLEGMEPLLVTPASCEQLNRWHSPAQRAARHSALLA